MLFILNSCRETLGGGGGDDDGAGDSKIVKAKTFYDAREKKEVAVTEVDIGALVDGALRQRTASCTSTRMMALPISVGSVW